jgi:PhnB protein
MAVQPIPEGYHTVTPYLVVPGAPDVIEFLKQVFGAEEMFRMAGPDGRVMHAEVRVGDSIIMMGEVPEGEAARPAMIHLYLEDVDAAYARALAAGATAVAEPKDQFYGDRSGGVEDAAGNRWWIATHVRDVPPEEMAAAMKEAGGGQ